MNNKIESIQVLGSGCPTCKKLFELTKLAVVELNLDIEVEYSNDIEKIMALGVMSSPVLAINNKAVVSGQLPSIDKLKELLTSEQKPVSSKEVGCHSCGCKH